MTKLYEYLGIPFGFVISLFYAISGNYLFSIFCLMIIIKLCLLPSSIKQQKGVAMQQRLQPKLRRIREKYAGNQQKIQEETQKIYQTEGFSPMAGGCAPMIIQLIVMTGLYQVNLHPFSMVLGVPTEVVTAIKEAVKPFLAESQVNNTYRLELFALQHWNDIDKSSILGLTDDLSTKIELFMQRFYIFGLDLSQAPDFKNFSDWAIPVISGVIALAMSVYSLIRQKKTNPEMAKNPSMGCMMLFTPLMQIYFAFLFPISVGIYIIMSTTISFVQMIILNHIYSPKKVLAKAMVEETIYRRSKEENTKKINEFKED